MKHETRAFPEAIEIREEETGRMLKGVAAVFNSFSQDLGGFREIIKPGSFTRTLKENPDIFALADHDMSKRLARTKNETLRLNETERGLEVEFDVPDTTLGNDTLTEVRTGLLDAMSFGFVVKDGEFADLDGEFVRIIRDVDLFEVSAVSFPAYTETTLDARSQFERWHKDNLKIKAGALARVRLKARLHPIV